MSVKPEALRLADRMAEGTGLDTQWDAAKELRRLHAENERLREALEIIAGCRQCVDPLMGNQDVAIAALRREGASDGLSAPSGPACHATDNGAVGAGSRRGATSGPTPE